jgi:hypothetical protein
VSRVGEAIARAVRGRPAVDVIALLPVIGGLALLAPLEYATGRAFGLGPLHAATITLVIEGFAAVALGAGRLVWLAIGLSTASAAVGLYRSVVEADIAAGRSVTPEQLGVAAAVTLLAGIALGGTHYIRSRVTAERAAAAAEAARLAAEQDEQREQARAERARAERAESDERARVEHERAVELQRLRQWEQQQTAEQQLAVERLRVESELQAERIRAEAEQARAATEQARAAGEQAAARAEQARARTERARTDREQLTARARAEAEQRAEQAAAAERRAAVTASEAQRIRTDRAYARQVWNRERWSFAETAERLGVAVSRARAIVAEWQRELPATDSAAEQTAA